jgi:hypothetical protein
MLHPQPLGVCERGLTRSCAAPHPSLAQSPQPNDGCRECRAVEWIKKQLSGIYAIPLGFDFQAAQAHNSPTSRGPTWRHRSHPGKI